MKKSILAILLAVAFLTPVFASEKKDMELDIKLGYTLDNNVKLYMYEEIDSGSTNMGCILGTDFYYYVASNLALGLGINYIFDSKANYGYDDKYGFTNIYFAVKPKMDLDSDILNSFYFIAQIGYGFFRLDYDNSPGVKYSTDNGLYWSLGFGLEILDNFILELIHSFNYGYVNVNNDARDMRYSTLSINVGYKFNL